MMKMQIDNIPDIYTPDQTTTDLFLYDLKMTENVVKNKVNLKMNMFSFLQKGKKHVHLAETSIVVDNKNSLLIKKGNCIWSELINQEDLYNCRLLFFSETVLKNFLTKHTQKESSQKTNAYFSIENDTYISTYLQSLSTIISSSTTLTNDLLTVKFEELLLYLLKKYKTPFKNYLYSLISEETSTLQKVVEQNLYSNLSIEEIAFLCNMSLSTFKRNFKKEYEFTPGKWFREKRLQKAKELLANKNVKPSDIYLDFGYNNLSNFSSSFKKQFGINPSEV